MNKPPSHCHNFRLCGNLLPIQSESIICMYCRILFGTWDDEKIGELEFYPKVECIICTNEGEGVKQPRCTHSICVPCFKRCYYGIDSSDSEPVFPYPEIEEEYYHDQHNPIWENEYPLILSYLRDWLEWDTGLDDNPNEQAYETYLKKCPLCRK